MDWAQGPWSAQFITVNNASYAKLQLEPRYFPNWIISYVKEGDVETETGGETYRAKAGSVMLHPPHLPFTERADTRGTHPWMQANIDAEAIVEERLEREARDAMSRASLPCFGLLTGTTPAVSGMNWRILLYWRHSAQLIIRM